MAMLRNFLLTHMSSIIGIPSSLAQGTFVISSCFVIDLAVNCGRTRTVTRHLSLVKYLRKPSELASATEHLRKIQTIDYHPHSS